MQVWWGCGDVAASDVAAMAVTVVAVVAVVASTLMVAKAVRAAEDRHGTGVVVCTHIPVNN